MSYVKQRNMNKDQLRKVMKAERNTLDKTFINSASQAITDTILNLDCIKNSDCVMIYLSAFNEPDTFALLKKLLNSGILVCVPVSNTDDFTITPAKITSTDDLTCGAYGILEPKSIIEVPISKIDTAVIPGIAFSKTGDRLGFGKGYYDRFLSEFFGTKIGLCYDFQLIESVPTDKYDIKMDIVISEKRIYNDF